MKPLEKLYTESPAWHERIGDIHALLERVKISEEQSGDALRLRKLNRIMSIHASTAIEGNQLTLGQVSDVINGKPVLGPPKDIKEVQNAWLAYDEMPNYDPWSIRDLLKAHASQANYYQALQEYNQGRDCRPFIDFMLDAIGNSLYKYIDIATETTADVGANVGVKVGVNEQILALLKREPRLSAKELAALLNKTTRTVERHIKELREQGRLRRVGSDKAGHWEIMEDAP